MQVVVITGANRGIGLELTKQLVRKKYKVIATCRKPEKAEELRKIKKQNEEYIDIIQLDVTDKESREKAVEEIEKITSKVDVLINNAGIIAGGTRRNIPFGELYKEDFVKVFKTNSIAPVLLTEKLFNLLQKAEKPRVVNISSQMGSITLKSYGGEYSYSASKAALNMFTKLMANDLRSQNIIVISMHPGWVKTDMGGPAAPITPEESAKGIINVIEKLSLPDSGKFFDYLGHELPW